MNEVVIKLIGNYSYQTSHCLGEGVYGKVFEGMERDTKEKVAIKKVDLNTFTNDKYLENAIFSEIYLLKRFNHPNIVKFKDVLSSKNSLYIITEFCRHGDLKEMIKRKRFKDEQAFDVVRQIACGFCQLNQEKIVHRDLKPANILVHEGVYKIADFGFAKYVDNFGSQMLKSCVGSPIYMAPQVLERTPYTTKCDIWSIGVIFYEMLFGSPPWKARDESELIKMVKTIPITNILKREPVSLKAAEFLKRTLAYNEDQRYSWNELFEIFQVRTADKTQYGNDDTSTAGSEQSQQRLRYMTAVGSVQRNNTPTKSAKKDSKYFVNAHSSSPVMEKKASGPPQSQISVTSTITNQSIPSSNNSYDMFKKVKDECSYKYFLCAELLIGMPVMKEIAPEGFKLLKQLYLLAVAIKTKNQITLGLMGLCAKLGKQFEELQSRMLKDQETYEEIERDITQTIDSEGQSKRLRDELTMQLGQKFEGSGEEKIVRIQQILLELSCQNATMLLGELRRKGRAIKDTQLSQLLEWMADLITLGTNKQRGLQEVSLMGKLDEADPADYFQKASTKLERLLNTHN